MTEKLKDYQVLDVLCGGTFYKVKHKINNKIFAWKAYNCSCFTDEQIENIFTEVKTISNVFTDNLLRYYDTILHSPSKTLYFVLEYNCWKSLEELIEVCHQQNKYIAESFIWYLLHELASVCNVVQKLQFAVIRKCITPSSIFVDHSGELRVNCFDLPNSTYGSEDLIKQVGEVIQTLCYRTTCNDVKIKEFHYSDDLQDIVTFLTDEKTNNLRPDIILYHPTVLANLETLAGPKNLSEIIIPLDNFTDCSRNDDPTLDKAVELCKSVEPAPRCNLDVTDSPIYTNICPKAIRSSQNESAHSQNSLSPTIAALALELPGFVPRTRQPFNPVLNSYSSPQKISERTLSQQWMSRLISLRQREESLNKRERDLIAKEIVNSPASKVIPLHDDEDRIGDDNNVNGITLPPMMSQKRTDDRFVNRRHKRSSSVRTRKHRKTYAYEDLDSSLSADPGDASMVITAKKITKENMPRRNIFPEVSTKKVHFTSANPFAESDESVTLTFYELENVDHDGYQVPRRQDKVVSDITKFKYLDLEKVTNDKRAAMHQHSQSSPSKQAKMTKNVFTDITNTQTNIRKTPSKSSLLSKGSVTSGNSHKSCKSDVSGSSGGSSFVATRSSMRLSLAPPPPVDKKKTKVRMSLLPFKTPFKFINSMRS